MPFAVDHHSLSRADFDALAAGDGDLRAVGQLAATDRSWRLVMLRAILDTAEPAMTEPLPPIAEAWAVMERVQQADPAVLDRLVVHPPAGMWAASVLRRLRGGTTVTGNPLWTELGYLHTLAAAGAIMAGIQVRIAVPVRHGDLVLPTLGRARFPSDTSWAVAEVQAAGGAAAIRCGTATVRVSSSGVDGPCWEASRRVRVGVAPAVYEVTLEDLDPYRGLLGQSPPNRLTASRYARWHQLLDDAWTILLAVDADTATTLAGGLRTLAPVPAAEPLRPTSASAGDAFGGAIASDPDEPAQLASTLVHEFQHIKLGGLMRIAPLFNADRTARFYAPWRDDPRPLGGLLQGIYAFVGVTRFWRGYRAVATGTMADLAHFEFALWREQTLLAVEGIRGRPELTAIGCEVVEAVLGRLESWRADPVPAGILTAARAAAADHRASWRAYHLHPDPARVAALAEAWENGEPPPAGDTAPAVLRPDPSARWLDTRANLVRLRLADPTTFDRVYRDDSDKACRQVAGTSPGDVAYVAGDRETALRAYGVQLAADPRNPAAWVGLALTLAAGDNRPAALARPELAKALAGRLAATRPDRPVPAVELAGWLDRSG
ncbi:MAG: aKG-HExxH-type peptide beta-hydroxylase [Mycobacteriales bacterium]